MANAVVIIVLVGAAELQEPSTQAALEAAQRSLDDRAAMVIEQAASRPPDADAIALERSRSAEAIVILAWHGAERLRASAHVHHATDGRWFERNIMFNRLDAATERGRTLGFALAAMLPSTVLRAPVPETNEPAPPPPPPSPPPREPPKAEPVDRERRSRIGLELTGQAAAAVDGDGHSFGGGVAGMVTIAARISLRASAAMRLGQVLPASSTSSSVVVGAGLEGLLHEASRRTPLSLGLHASAVAAHEGMTYDDGIAGRRASASRWLPGASTGLFGVWFLTDAVGVTLGAQAELLFGKTDVFVDGSHVGQLARLRIAGAGGARVRF